MLKIEGNFPCLRARPAHFVGHLPVVCLTNEHAAFGKVIGDPLVLLLILQKQARRYQGYIIQACPADRSRWSANVIGKFKLFHMLQAGLLHEFLRVSCHMHINE